MQVEYLNAFTVSNWQGMLVEMALKQAA